MPDFRTVGEVADHFQIPPRTISDLFYARALDAARCPIVGKCRLIPGDYLPELEEVLRDRGLIETCEAR